MAPTSNRASEDDDEDDDDDDDDDQSTPPPPPPRRGAPVRVERVVTSTPKRSLVQAWSASVQRQRVSFYRSLTVMLGAGLPMFSVFEFLSRQAESEEQREACRRISLDLVAGYPLHKAAYNEPTLFSEIAVKLVEIGMRTGKLVAVLQRVAADEEHRWRLRQTLQSHLFYPVCIASLTMVAVMLLPPLVLADLLEQVVRLTAEPPAITKAILLFSSSLSKPPFLIAMAALAAGVVTALRSARARQILVNLEPMCWDVPGLGSLIQSAVSLRFLRVFSMTYDVGLTAPQCLVLATEATGSRKAICAGPRMRDVLIDGGTLRDSLESGDFLPRIVVEAVEAGQQSGDVSGMMDSVARIVDAELEYRIESLMAVIEPLFMAVLGVFVGFFAIGCLLPILKLSESL
jgi:type IV pilus assembly protein PilC